MQLHIVTFRLLRDTDIPVSRFLTYRLVSVSDVTWNIYFVFNLLSAYDSGVVG